jgi:peptidoglycan/LPS O-acetylase OafA/YrhL
VIGNKVFSYVGKISYSVYLWHWPIHLWMEPYEWLALPSKCFSRNFITFFKFVGSFLIGSISHHLIEKPFISGYLSKKLNFRKTVIILGIVLTTLLLVNSRQILMKNEVENNS